jgi:dUTP pyrophosphatase
VKPVQRADREGQARARAVGVRVIRLPHADDLALAAYQSDGAAGLDLLAAVDRRKPIRLAPGDRVLVPTGLILELPQGLEAQVRPRSGLALRHGVTVLNSPGTIDCDYRGELKVLLVNLGDAAFAIARGARIAQLVIQRCVRASLIETDHLAQTRRGSSGFGSTGSVVDAAKGKAPASGRPAGGKGRPRRS